MKDNKALSIVGSSRSNGEREKDVLYVLNSKESPTKLAKEFNVTYRTIANIKSRKTWKHLD